MRFLLPEKTFQHDLSPKTHQDVAADSNTPDLLEPCSQDSPKGLPQGEPVQTSSPSLLHSYGNTSPVETGTTQATSAAEASCDAPRPAQGPQVSGGSQATLPSLSPAFPVLPSSRLQSLPEGMPHREQADSSGTAFPPARARTQGGDAVGAKRKLLAGDGQALPALSGQQHSQGAPWGRGRGRGRRVEFTSTWGTKRSRKEEQRRGKELSEEEEEEKQASPVSGPSSSLEQHRALQPVKMKQLVGSPGGGGVPGELLCVPPPLVSIPEAFPHLAGGDGELKAGGGVDASPNPPEGGSGALGEGVVEPELAGNQHLLEHLPALRLK